MPSIEDVTRQNAPAGRRGAVTPPRPAALRPRGRLIQALAALFCIAPALAAPARADEATLAGAAAWARLLGNTVAGTTPDGPYAELFGADGTFTIVDNDGKAVGRWSLKGERLCTEIDDEEECRSIEVRGPSGAFIDEGGGRYPFTILPGNPKNL